MLARMEDEILDRLQDVSVPIKDALVIGLPSAAFLEYLSSQSINITVCDIESPDANVICDEDKLVFEADRFDVVFSCGVLDTVNDLPGALILIRHVLKPGGVFMAAFPGAGSLPSLRAMMLEEAAVARTHPQIDVRNAGDLLSRAGFTMPLADHDVVTVRYRGLKTLLQDLRANGFSNALHDISPLKASPKLRKLLSMDSPFEETICLLYITGWKATAQEPLAKGPVKGLFPL